MAGIRKKGAAYYCTFRFQGRRHYFSVGPISEAQARAKGIEVDETLDLIERGRLTVPDGVRIEDFVSAGGKHTTAVVRPSSVAPRNLFDDYLNTLANGNIERTSLGTIRTHLNQFALALGKRFRMQNLTLSHLQQYVQTNVGRFQMGIRARLSCASTFIH